MKLVYIHPVGGNLYMVQEVHGGHVDNELPGGGPVDPGYGHGGVRPPRPGHELPAIPGVPDNTLPTTPPPQPPSGKYLVMVRTPDGKWRWATVDAPPITLPEPPPGATPKA